MRNSGKKLKTLKKMAEESGCFAVLEHPQYVFDESKGIVKNRKRGVLRVYRADGLGLLTHASGSRQARNRDAEAALESVINGNDDEV
ncbi:MAG: hypothetical protein GY861_21725 [bacterium]|nr:hypothetical protein [bacterium]